MTALQLVEDPPVAVDPLVARLDEVLAQLSSAVADCSEVANADRTDRIARLEKLQAVTAAVQAAECVRFAQSQVAEQQAADVHPKAVGRGIADQIALACHLSPVAGSRRPAVETRHLDARARRAVDTAVEAAGITGIGVKATAACARQHPYATDPRAYVEQGRTER